MNRLQYCPGKMELDLLQGRLRSHQHHREQQLQGQLGYHFLDRVLQNRLCILPGEHKVPSQLLCLWHFLAHQHSAQTLHQLCLLCVFHVRLHQLAVQLLLPSMPWLQDFFFFFERTMAARLNDCAPINLLLHSDTLKSHLPFHLAGGGGIPAPLNEGWLGNTPPSSTPMITPFPKFESFQIPACWFSPKKLGVCVVFRRNTRSGCAATKPFICSIAFTSS
ncbi:hypothetical protein RchiOBHm_Chr7g0200031 [Rosa chinensis]|uniref:Uncharacterized protein n=1 Tax=Rosa chinensis TaxID=74649 RepID=A0A2P6P7N4_ROSCH|nr:hypothetical protein RchiOBHm_Chr7g0200031 [Rosa chinensis]